MVWIIFFAFVLVDNTKLLSTKDIGFWPSLEQSALARTMFADIGILSTILAGWAAFGTKEKLRYVFAIATLVVGSLAFLPLLSF